LPLRPAVLFHQLVDLPLELLSPVALLDQLGLIRRLGPAPFGVEVLLDHAAHQPAHVIPTRRERLAVLPHGSLLRLVLLVDTTGQKKMGTAALSPSLSPANPLSRCARLFQPPASCFPDSKKSGQPRLPCCFPLSLAARLSRSTPAASTRPAPQGPIDSAPVSASTLGQPRVDLPRDLLLHLLPHVAQVLHRQLLEHLRPERLRIDPQAQQRLRVLQLA